MKLTCTQSDLNSNLSLVSRAVPSRPTHPVLANVLLIADVENQCLELTGFDLSLGIRSNFPAVVETGGSFTLPAKLFNDIVSRLPDGNITIDDDEGEALAEPSGSYIATLTSTSGRYEVRGMGGEEYPELPKVEEGEVIHLPPEALINGLKGTLFATSPDETKQVLTGVHLKVQKDGLEFAATDGHRLAIVKTESVALEGESEVEEIEEIEEFEVTIPAKALREIERMIGMRQSSEAVALKFDEGQVIFELGEQCLTSRKLEGQYPAYGQLLPDKFTNQINVNRKEFLGAVERIAVLADQKNNILKCSIDSVNQEISLSVDAQDVGSGRESMAAQISSDEPEEIAFNVKYLIEGLKAIPSASEISIQLNTATSPVVLNPLGGVKMTYLIMPVQLRN
ncbi:DNA polymerase III subunit beta [Okeania sp. SIO2B3]|uniref:DNA polymerase III subunit beta n=1 Tax=Okeania sp. SIO2B3 TaxID=2607784 RepID=UPI0013BED3C6|nr:DNA polymerase III subunit beta [Okeania sp. SIO2B3]NET46204.1 DNA polymerase III subunit beta [Okeania sp. SIO2B3]